VGLSTLVGCVINPAFDPPAQGSSGSESSGGTTGTEAAVDTGDSTGPSEVELPGCAALPTPPDDAIAVTPDQAAGLPSIIASASPGATFVLEPGRYAVDDTVLIAVDGVTLRSSTGDADDVVLDLGEGAFHGIRINASNVTLAEFTVEGGADYQVVVSGGNVVADDALLYRMRFLDPRAAAIRANTGLEGTGADRGVLACSELRLRDEARGDSGGCTGGGISGYGVWDWTVRDNVFEGFWCSAGFAGAAVTFSEGAAGTRVERNVIREATQGIVLGIHELYEPARAPPSCGPGVYFDHVGGAVRNNAIVSVSEAMAASEVGLDTGLGLWNVCGTKAVHNTVLTAIPAFTSIEYRFPNTQATVANNLVTHPIFDRDEAGVPSAGNLEVDLSVFVSPLQGDFHLLPGTEPVDAGVQLAEDAVDHDVDGEARDAAPDVGADEL